MSVSLPYAILAVAAFTLHVIWERAHIHLYTGYEAMQGTLPAYLNATIGDVAYTLLAVLLVALLKGNIRWIIAVRVHEYAGLALIGLWIALFVEYKAMAFAKWAYTDAMPLVSGVGVSPLLQMTILLPLSVFVSTIISRRFLRL